MDYSQCSTTEIMARLKKATERFDRLTGDEGDNQAVLCPRHHIPEDEKLGCYKCEQEILAAEARADERREGNF